MANITGSEQVKSLPIKTAQGKEEVRVCWAHTIIIGSGASGLNAAIQLYRAGVSDILIITEGLDKGTSINTGSDKQTYYKLSVCGSENDSPRTMAENYFQGGAMHGDIALVESSLSIRAFMNLVNLGIPFPRDKYGQFVGYKTDHDPRQRATSIGPYTSREMCKHLISEVKRLGIRVIENREVIQFVTDDDLNPTRIIGFFALGEEDQPEAYVAENIVFGVGGPGGLYRTSVYPQVAHGAIGLALMAGADACNLSESQFGLASTQFRWNVSGSYMQVIPRFISRSADGISDEKEFLNEYFSDPNELFKNIFLKGYQWPFDAAKTIGGSSIIDILVYIESVEKGRKVFLDFRKNPKGFSIDKLPEEPKDYLIKSGALQPTPIERLRAMNQPAINLYLDHGIDLSQEPLEVAICAQHNNGGLSANIWWESSNFSHFFPVGEVNGSHGVSRPGGSALNSGQVGGFRAAEFIATVYKDRSLNPDKVKNRLHLAGEKVVEYMNRCKQTSSDCRAMLDEIQDRMTRAGAHIRSKELLEKELKDAKVIVEKISNEGCGVSDEQSLKFCFRVRQLALSHLVYLDAILHTIENKVGSRGSSIVLDTAGEKIKENLDDKWRIEPEDRNFRGKILHSKVEPDGNIHHSWEEVRPIPDSDAWFETAWAEFRSGGIYNLEKEQ